MSLARVVLQAVAAGDSCCECCTPRTLQAAAEEQVAMAYCPALHLPCRHGQRATAMLTLVPSWTQLLPASRPHKFWSIAALVPCGR